MNENTFPASRRDLDNLKQTAVDAAKDLSSTAAVHAEKAKGQFNDLAGHVREEGSEHLNRVRGSLNDVTVSARDYLVARPFAALGIAFGLGVLFGFTSRGCNKA